MSHIRFVLFPLLAFVVIGPCSETRGADYWPGWMGPGRDGWVRDFQPPERWPERLQRRWQVDVGIGYGSPLVADGRVYQHARQGEDEVLWCLDLATGGLKWRQTYAAPFKIAPGGEYHGKGPKSSPTISDGRVFTLSIAGVLSAFDAATGQRLWHRDYADQFEKGHPNWGAATSPLVDGPRVIVHFGTDEEGSLLALDAKTGRELWSQGSDGPSYSSPLLVEIDGVRQVVEWNHEAVVGVESATGHPLWSYPFPHLGHDQNMPTPVFHDGRVILGGENRGIMSLAPQRNGPTWSVKRRWFQDDVALDMSTAVINDGLLYGFSHYGKGRIFCLDTKTGNVLWQGPGRGGENMAFLSVLDHVLALNDEGQLHVVAATGQEFQKTVTYRVAEEATWAPPVLLQQGVLIKDTQHLSLWTFE